jgi:hypothetical protein
MTGHGNRSGHISAKRVMIDKSNAVVLGSLSAAIFVVVFAGFAFRELLSKRSYQAKVISSKQTALKQLQDNIKSVDTLVEQYKAFATSEVNLIGGSSTGSGPRDGDNPKIVLDSLPSQYDLPGHVSSLENILLQGGYSIKSIGGTETSEGNNATPVEGTVLEIAVPMAVNVSYEAAQTLLATLEKSIRPIYVDKIDILAGAAGIEMTLSTRTFYQPEKTYRVEKQVVQ